MKLWAIGYPHDSYFDWEDVKGFVNDCYFRVEYPPLPQLWTAIFILWNEYDKKVFETKEFLRRNECRAKFWDILQDKENLDFLNAQHPKERQLETKKKTK